ncbi:MAG: tetratricopeptide repeat protein [Pirellulaceae bacterium]|nr:tetratricopeptide repeat protein [Pirellulaceae bacterium]
MPYKRMPINRHGLLFLVSLLLLCFSNVGCRIGGLGQNSVGVQMFQQGRYAEALQQFESAKQTDPGNPDTYYNLASTYHRMGVTQKDSKLIEQSESLYNQCLDLSPNHTACYRGLAVLLVETNRSDKAFALLKNWTKQSPTLSDARIELAKMHQEFNQTTVAEQYLDEALSMDPNNAIAWAAKGRLREATGDLVQARQNYSQSLALNSLQPEVYQRVAALDLRMGQQAIQNTIVGTQTTIANGTGPGTAAGTTTPNGGNKTSQLQNTSAPRY